MRVAGASVAEVVVDDATAVFCKRNKYVCAKSVGVGFQNLLEYERALKANPVQVEKRRVYDHVVHGAGYDVKTATAATTRVREGRKETQALARGKLARAVHTILQDTSIDIDAPLSQHEVALQAAEAAEIAKQSLFELYQTN